ncbi:hypothetical protein Asi03nite_14210 [Actinoplanes siamensis]|uniref:Uncharacterized protein n=1 Tax=Actinoplanes siamensis TaxID=1223317 RepID=A0A919N3T7_9ACTN|nr:hypothetical protein Asi03nite_14210 [Actinoplanes siamensis]
MAVAAGGDHVADEPLHITGKAAAPGKVMPDAYRHGQVYPIARREPDAHG